uniref:CSON000264 protein n=1 Tax=Culicoides sonorensis TaxID=179676 RepID=A0A336MJQ3_CULSO
MKKVMQPVVRKIYGGSQQTQGQTTQIQQQQNAVRKINSLLQSGTVSVTQSSANQQPQTKVIQRQYTQTTTTTGRSGLQINQTSVSSMHRKCFICDEPVQTTTAHSVPDTFTASTHTKLSTKIARLVGEGYMVIIAPDDVLCRRCFNLFNMMDKAEADVERHKTTINSFLKKKYSILDEVIDVDAPNNGNLNRLSSPPVKMQRLNNITGNNSVNRVISQQNNSDSSVQLRKINVNSSPATSNDLDHSSATNSPSKPQKGPTKLYKCMSCDYKSTDLSTFDSHYQECKGQNNNKSSPNTNQTVTKKIITTSQIHACSMCTYKTADKANYEEHVRKHYKMRPFKCRICTQRFETREQAQVHAKTHQPDYFKCGMCSATFNRRDLLMKHLESHDKTKQQIQMVSSVHAVTTPSNTTQKLLQETIDEALRDSGSAPAATSAEINAKNIQFHSCDTCSVTFLNEALYLQHMKQHGKTGGNTVQKSFGSGSVSGSGNHSRTTSNNGSYSEEMNVKQEQQQQQNTVMSDDLESIFERMHADKAEINANAANTANTENLVITQENTSTGGITFNITIPQSAASGDENSASNQQQISIDMPTLDADPGTETKVTKQEEVLQAPVSMPSLDDDQDGNTQESHVSNTDAVPMELDEMQGGADGQQIKFILNENGQIMSLDNHILTTDMDGNQILVQGTDMEQLQAILQSGGVIMQGEEGIGEGQTLQMLSTGDGQNQMVIIQGADGQEAQLIDASMLDADGNIVLQQHPTGELNAEGTHITTEDGIQIPVSITFGGAEGDHITVQEGSEEQLQLMQQQAEQDQAEHEEGGQTLMLLQQGGEDQNDQQMKQEAHQDDENTQETTQEGGQGTEEATDENSANNTSNNEGFLNFDELIQPQIINKETTATTTSIIN